MRVYMDRRVTPPRRVTSPTRGLPPPCKQALTVPSAQGMSCEKEMRTCVVITALNRGYASELEYFAAETHLVVVPCVIFSSHLSVYHLVRSFAVLQRLRGRLSYSLPIQVVEVTYFPSHYIAPSV